MVIILPIIAIFLFNTLTIQKTRMCDKEREIKLQVKKVNVSAKRNSSLSQIGIENEMKQLMSNQKLKPLYMSKHDLLKLNSNPVAKNSSLKMTGIHCLPHMNYIYLKLTFSLSLSHWYLKGMLMIISFSFCILNMPYLCVWLVYIYKKSLLSTENDSLNYLVALLRITETIQILNYTVISCIFF